MNKPFSVFNAALRYEFRMQVHRRELWIATLLITLVLAGLIFRIPGMMQTLQGL